MTQEPARSVLVSRNNLNKKRDKYALLRAASTLLPHFPAVLKQCCQNPPIWQVIWYDQNRAMRQSYLSAIFHNDSVHLCSTVLLCLNTQWLLITDPRSSHLTAVLLDNCSARPCSQYSHYIWACWTCQIIYKYDEHVTKWTLQPRKRYIIWIFKKKKKKHLMDNEQFTICTNYRVV